MPSTAHTATVEVLTAEVRVLQVGARQVTLSVFNQLDWVRPDEIIPFGRVRPRDAVANCTDVVGRSARAADRGALVRSYSYDPAHASKTADRARCRVHAAWQALPLIVLAGLR